MCRTLTLRIENPKTDEQLTKIMSVMKEKTAAKTVIKLIDNYSSVCEQLQSEKRKVEVLEQELNHYKFAIESYLNGRAALEKCNRRLKK